MQYNNLNNTIAPRKSKIKLKFSRVDQQKFDQNNLRMRIFPTVEFLLPSELSHDLSRSRVSEVMREFFNSLPVGCVVQILYQHEKDVAERRYIVNLAPECCCGDKKAEQFYAQKIANYFIASGMAARVVELDKVRELTEVKGCQKTIRLETEIDTTDSNITEFLRETLQDVHYTYILSYKRGNGFDQINSGALGTYGLGIILTDVDSEVVMAAQDAMFEMGGGVTSVVRRTKNSSMSSFKPIFQGDSFLVADLIPA